MDLVDGFISPHDLALPVLPHVWQQPGWPSTVSTQECSNGASAASSADRRYGRCRVIVVCSRKSCLMVIASIVHDVHEQW